MHYTPITPFGRLVEAVPTDVLPDAITDLPARGVDKWTVLRELTDARATLGVTDRALGVLQVLLGFHPHTILGGDCPDTIVFPSNAAICRRLNGMPCSTMRRHLACLVRTGFIIRRDSPNGKRFRRVHRDGTDAYGFDLAPLVLRFDEIRAAAESTRAEADALIRLRRTISLMRRDLAGLASFGAATRPDVTIWTTYSDLAASVARALRRKLSIDDLRELVEALKASLDMARDTLDAEETSAISSTSASHIEQHHQNSDKKSPELERTSKGDVNGAIDRTTPAKDGNERKDGETSERECPNVSLGMVVAACREYRAYVPDRVRHWNDLVHVADTLAPMMGISRSAWDQAVDAMGAEEAAVTVLCILDRGPAIASPGGYLRRLTRLALENAFSCGPMVTALLRRRDGPDKSSQL